MSSIQIHRDFRLEGQAFSSINAFLDFVAHNFKESYPFLEQWFDDTTTLTVYTSGSTGKPKEIRLSKKAMLASAEATGVFFDLPSKTRVLHCLSSHYIAGKMMWIRALHLGWHLKLVLPDQKPLLGKDESFDFCAMVPLQVQNSFDRITQIKKLIIGGAPLSDELILKLSRLPISVFQTYGMTETVTHIAVRKLEQGKDNPYMALPNVFLSKDSRNCLVIEAQKISSQKIITNDVINLLTPYSFYWLGRFDHIINSGGVKLFPERIEQKIAPFIKDPFIISSRPDTHLGERLLLLVESKIAYKDIHTIWQQAKLTKFEIPKEVHYFTQFIYTGSGKINRVLTTNLLTKK